MRFNHLMIDLETLGTAANAPVIAIGAVFFDPNTGTLGDTFDAAIDVEDAMRYGVMSGSTFKWWLGQSDAARQKVVRGRERAEDVFNRFGTFTLKHGDNVQPWGNGSSFDIAILDHAFPRILNKPAPWKFWNVRDCRTIKELATGIVKYDDKMQGVAHTALDDAIHQAKYVSAYWQGLRKSEKYNTFFYYHPESDCAFTSQRNDLNGLDNGCVEEIDEEKFLEIIRRQAKEVAVSDSELLI